MKNVLYEIALQHNDWGYFCQVEMRVKRDLGLDKLIINIDSNCEAQWESAIAFGVTYAWEKVRSKTKGCQVSVVKVRGFEVDTTNIVVAFCAMNAFWQAVGEKPVRMPTLEKEKGVFTIPK